MNYVQLGIQRLQITQRVYRQPCLLLYLHFLHNPLRKYGKDQTNDQLHELRCLLSCRDQQHLQGEKHIGEQLHHPMDRRHTIKEKLPNQVNLHQDLQYKYSKHFCLLNVGHSWLITQLKCQVPLYTN